MTAPTRIAGLDPGLHGAIAWLDSEGQLAGIEDMPIVGDTVNAGRLYQLICEAGTTIAIVERVHAMPKQGVTSSFNFGRSYGTILAVLACADVPLVHVTPTVWKRAVGVTADKETSRRKAIDLWPFNQNLFARKKDADRAEAALIAYYWWEKTR